MIHETVVTTENADGSIHIAPMGIHDDKGNIILAPFRPSTTLDNLVRSGEAVVNFTDDVRIFAGCVTGRRNWPTRPATKVAGGVLDAALAHAEVRVERIDEDELRPRFHCQAVHLETHAPFAGFNRAQAAVLEGAILVSRLDRLAPEKIEREIDYLRIAIEKTAGERERIAWRWLMERIDAWHRHGAAETRPS